MPVIKRYLFSGCPQLILSIKIYHFSCRLQLISESNSLVFLIIISSRIHPSSRIISSKSTRFLPTFIAASLLFYFLRFFLLMLTHSTATANDFLQYPAICPPIPLSPFRSVDSWTALVRFSLLLLPPLSTVSATSSPKKVIFPPATNNNFGVEDATPKNMDASPLLICGMGSSSGSNSSGEEAWKMDEDGSTANIDNE